MLLIDGDFFEDILFFFGYCIEDFKINKFLGIFIFIIVCYLLK